MPREFEISNNEKQFILEALNENLRLDGRALDSFRKAELKFGDDYGLADLKIGKTRSDEDLVLSPLLVLTSLQGRHTNIL